MRNRYKIPLIVFVKVSIVVGLIWLYGTCRVVPEPKTKCKVNTIVLQGECVRKRLRDDCEWICADITLEVTPQGVQIPVTYCPKCLHEIYWGRLAEADEVSENFVERN